MGKQNFGEGSSDEYIERTDPHRKKKKKILVGRVNEEVSEYPKGVLTYGQLFYYLTLSLLNYILVIHV